MGEKERKKGSEKENSGRRWESTESAAFTLLLGLGLNLTYLSALVNTHPGADDAMPTSWSRDAVSRS